MSNESVQGPTHNEVQAKSSKVDTVHGENSGVS